MQISVVTVSLNSARTIAQTIASVFAQHALVKEYFIIDGLSSDSTVEIAKTFESRFRDVGVEYKIISEKDNGIYQAMNKGIALCTGSIVAILNSDDWYLEDTFEKVMQTFKKYPTTDILHGNLIYYGNGNSKQYSPKDSDSRLFWFGMTLFHPTFFVRRGVYEKIRYDESYRVISDYKFVLEAKQANLNFLYLNEPLTHMREGGAGTVFSRRILEGHRVRVDVGFNAWVVWASTAFRILISLLSRLKKLFRKVFCFFLKVFKSAPNKFTL